MTAKLCLNPATTMPSSFEMDAEAYAAAGFRHTELWLAKVRDYLKTHTLDDARKVLDRAGIEAAAACAFSGLALVSGDARKPLLADYAQTLEICQALGAPVLITTPGPRPDEVTDDLWAQSVANLREAADLAQPYGITLAFEFLKGAPYLNNLETAVRLVSEVDRPNVGVLFDTFHFYAGMSQMPDLDLLTRQNLAFVHVNDARPMLRERMTDADRVPLGEGCFPLKAILGKIAATGYDGAYSLELFNRAIWEEAPASVAMRCRKSMETFFAGL